MTAQFTKRKTALYFIVVASFLGCRDENIVNDHLSSLNMLKAKMMNNHFELTDFEFEEKFEKRIFDPELFSHEAHIRLAWIQINK